MTRTTTTPADGPYVNRAKRLMVFCLKMTQILHCTIWIICFFHFIYPVYVECEKRLKLGNKFNRPINTLESLAQIQFVLGTQYILDTRLLLVHTTSTPSLYYRRPGVYQILGFYYRTCSKYSNYGILNLFNINFR